MTTGSTASTSIADSYAAKLETLGVELRNEHIAEISRAAMHGSYTAPRNEHLALAWERRERADLCFQAAALLRAMEKALSVVAVDPVNRGSSE